MAKVLVIDDDPLIGQSIAHLVGPRGHQVTSCQALNDASKVLSAQDFDIVFLDIRLPDGNGLDALPAIQNVPSHPEVIIMTGFGDPDGAELAMKFGVWDYIQKPSTVEAITASLTRALQYRMEKKPGRSIAEIEPVGIVGNSPKMKACLQLVAKVASSDANVLITGETGTGKEVFAVAIHKNSRRADKAFVVVDCAALPENLVESILFGHVRGAFTSADRAQEGLVLQASGGTLFLDEVGELPRVIQKSFLRVLQEKKFRPVGGKQELESNFRVISASHRNLDEMVRQGTFREDLLFRLRSFSIELPPLRERVEDIPELAAHFMDELCRRDGIERKLFSPEFLNTLRAYSWQGNIRELIHALERALINARDEHTLVPKHLPADMRAKVALSTDSGKEAGLPERWPAPERLWTIQQVREKAVAEAEEKYLRELIDSTRGNIREATERAGLSRSRLYSLLKKYRMTP